MNRLLCSSLTSLPIMVLLAVSAVADDKASTEATTTELKFDDAREATVQGRLVGPGKHEYTFTARKGQKVVLELSSDRSPWIGMDLLAPTFSPAEKPTAAKDENTVVFAATLRNAPAVYTNFIDGSTRWEGIAPGDGTYTVRLGLLSSQARKMGRIDYELDVNLK